MSDFVKFSRAVHDNIKDMSKGELYVADIGGDELWDAYLKAFPEGSDPIYRTNTTHTCSCCKSFIRGFGNVVSIKDGVVRSIWGTDDFLPYPYDVVATALHQLVLSRGVKTIFRTNMRAYGAETTKERLDNGSIMVWEHFHGQVAAHHYSNEPDTAKGNFNTALQVFRRGLEEITVEALIQIEDMIKDNLLYRGEEHLKAVREFKDARIAYGRLSDQAKQLKTLERAMTPYARFRNTVIGTLAVDLSNGMDMEDAVKAFESKVAPQNYKRPKALITPAMVKDATKTIADLGLEPALQRRLANIRDITVNNVLWADRKAKAEMKGGVGALLMSATKVSAPTKGRDISIEDFMAQVVPTATTMDLFLSSRHAGNFVTLTAPVVPDTPQLFRWANGFAWSYDGDVTDSIKERVKRAGGNVNAKVRVSLSWFNHDDLDIHALDPMRGEICYYQKKDVLDVDMNAGYGKTREPVENLAWDGVMKDGTYQVWVEQFAKRESRDTGFVIEVEANGEVRQFSYDQPVRGDVTVGEFVIKNGQYVGFMPHKNMVEGGNPVEKWGVKSEQFIRVETLIYSPNHWDDQGVGNRHYIFALEGCRTDAPVRGIYNEFLRPELEKHRRVFEVLGDRAKCTVVPEQLSGLGFSSTRNDTVTVRCDGQVFNIKF